MRVWLYTTSIFLVASSCFAVTTIVSVSGSQPNDGFDDINSSFSPALQFTLTQPLSNISISLSSSIHSTAGATARAYITTQIGPGTTAASEIAKTDFAFPLVDSFVSPNLTLFSGLTLAANTYYLTFVNTGGANFGDLGIVQYGTAITNSGASVGNVLYTTSPGSYSPAATYVHQGFGGNYYLPIITITGDNFTGGKATVLVSPPSLSFGYDLSVAGPVAPQTLSVSSTSTNLPFNVSSVNPSWLSASTTSSSTPAVITTNVTRTQAVGTYYSLVDIEAPGASNPHQFVPVALTVTNTPGPSTRVISTAPSSLSFSYQEGSLPPSTQFINIQSVPSPIPFFVSTLISGGRQLVFPLTTAKSTPQTIGFSVDPQLTAGTYTSEISFQSSLRDGGGTVVPVSIKVTPVAPPPVVRSLDFTGKTASQQPKQTLSEYDLWKVSLSFLKEARADMVANQSADACYNGTIDALFQGAKQQLNEIPVNTLAINIATLPLSIFPAESVLGKVLLKSGAFLISTLASDNPTQATLEFATEETAGYILSKAVGDYTSGLVAAGLSESGYVTKILQSESVVVGTINITNNRSAWLSIVPFTETTATLTYDPYTHYAIIGANSVCNGASKRQYLFRFEVTVEKDLFFNQPKIRGSVTSLTVP